MVREGALEVHQQQAFAPIFLRKRADEDGRGTARHGVNGGG
jgi:hypothetical protein